MVAVLQRSAVPTQAEFHQAISSRSDRWFSACLRITHSRELAEDAVQEGLLSAWNKRDQFEHGARLETWIHRIAVNAALQLIRKQRPNRWNALEDDVADNADRPDIVVANAELSDNLLSAMRHLTEIERLCFVLKHLEQWRLAEIAAELDVSVSSVKQALFRAVKKLRLHMQDLRNVPP